MKKPGKYAVVYLHMLSVLSRENGYLLGSSTGADSTGVSSSAVESFGEAVVPRFVFHQKRASNNPAITSNGIATPAAIAPELLVGRGESEESAKGAGSEDGTEARGDDDAKALGLGTGRGELRYLEGVGTKGRGDSGGAKTGGCSGMFD